ncbi:hypothetical protein Raf01_73340 [Rugosimonospora africana]|uniref:Uncharacterized protein n=1 Tax=Rugosimonospora africana TaxID=556532 RepID=A0A8J3QZP8_9ACTN|nr:hypothetical protein Raf01_73340 [Rugosimonospora africana]
MYDTGPLPIRVRTFHTSSRRAASGPLARFRGTVRAYASGPGAHRPRTAPADSGHHEAQRLSTLDSAGLGAEIRGRLTLPWPHLDRPAFG